MENIFKFICSKEVIGTIIIIVLTYIVYKICYSIIDNATIKGKDELVKKRRKTFLLLVKNTIKYILIILMVLALLSLYGFNINSLLAGLGIAGVVLGLGLQDALKDIFSGISIIFDDYFVVGDIVDYEGFVGTIIEFGLKSTKIRKYTGEVLIVSNRSINKITNITKEKSTVDIKIPTAYEEDILKVEKVINNIISKVKMDNKDILDINYLGIENFNDSSIDYLIRFTCKRGAQWDLKRVVLREIKLAYDKNNVKIPYNQLEVHNGEKL